MFLRFLKRNPTKYRSPGVARPAREAAREAAYALVLTVSGAAHTLSAAQAEAAMRKAKAVLERVGVHEKNAGPEMTPLDLEELAQILNLAGDLCRESARLGGPIVRPKKTTAPQRTP